MAVLEVEDLRRSYGAFEALKGVSFRIESGEIVGLLGPNGAGKSTTMKIVTGFLAPTGGQVRVCGLDVLAEPIETRRFIGYLPESAPIYAEMDVRAYLAFIGRVRGLGAAERARAIERVAEECGLVDRLRQRVGTLSRGYRQRVGLAQALLHSPRLLILDEPTNGLDPKQIIEIRSLIRRVGETRTVVLSTHILSEVQVTCDRVLIIHQGRLVADGATEEVIASTSGQVVTVGVAAGKVKAEASAVQAQLGAVPGVAHVEVLAPVDEAMRFAVHASSDVREEIFRWAVARGHVLVELSSERSNLEEVFRRLTAESGLVRGTAA
jgi:ABC-2 type transport system ATP-binding protein